MNNRSGKVLTAFLMVIAILLTALVGISLFYLSKEIEVRKAYEVNLEQMEMKEKVLQETVAQEEKNNFLNTEQIKELEEELESLHGELDLVEGVRDEIKKDNRELQESLDKKDEEKETLRAKLLQEISEANEKISALQEEVKAAVARNKELDGLRKDFQDKYVLLRKQLEDHGITPQVEMVGAVDTGMDALGERTSGNQVDMIDDIPMDLETIIINPDEMDGTEGEGKVITIDNETEFIIVNLGEQDGVEDGTELSIYRGSTYVGEAMVTRVLPEMAAADLIPPLKSLAVRKDDRVIIKK